MAKWDWVYEHRWVLLVIGGLAVVALVWTVVIAARRHSIGRGLVWGALPLIVIAATIVAWRVADDRSLASDLEHRVRFVAAALPGPTVRTKTLSGDNFHIETYRVPGDASAAATQFQHGLETRVSEPSHVYPIPQQPTGAPAFEVTFLDRDSCDGLVQVSVHFSDAGSDTTVEVSGNCED